MQAISKDYKNSVCEVKTLKNDLLIAGHITEVEEDYIQIESNSEDILPLVKYGQAIKISVFNAKKGFKILAGTAYLSTDLLLRVINVQSLLEFERRNFFRVNTEMETKLFRISEEDDSEVIEDEPIDVLVENISLNGVLLSCTGVNFMLNDKFVIELLVPENKLSFHCCVKRIENQGGENQRFGCEFFDHTERQSDILCKYVFELQRAIIRKKKQEK